VVWPPLSLSRLPRVSNLICRPDSSHASIEGGHTTTFFFSFLFFLRKEKKNHKKHLQDSTSIWVSQNKQVYFIDNIFSNMDPQRFAWCLGDLVGAKPRIPWLYIYIDPLEYTSKNNSHIYVT